MPDQTYYDLLEVNSLASPDEIRAAYRRLAKEYHPDTIPEEMRARRIGKEAAEMFKLVTAAYEVLIDPIKRKIYDEALRGLDQPASPQQPHPSSSPPSPPSSSATASASPPPGPPSRWEGRRKGFALIALAAAIFLYGIHLVLTSPSSPPTVRGPRSDRAALPALLNKQEAESRAQIDPLKYPGLPELIAADLSARECTIPQAYFVSEIHNAISGEFTRPGQTDWAVMCVQNETVTILLYPNGEPVGPITVYGPQKDQIVSVSGREREGLHTGYNEAINAVDEDYIMSHYRAYGGSVPPPIDHQGINVACCEQSSQVLYWYENKWYRLQGAD